MAAPFHLRSLQALEMAVRAGSFVGAVDALGITPAAVAQRVKALEDYPGIRLLVRRRSGITPTHELIAALPALGTAFAALETAMDALEAQRGHDIHIAAPSDVIDLWLLPRLAAFRVAYPGLRFCINGEGDAPLRLGRADVEIGFGEAGDGVDVLFHDLVVPLASPSNVKRLAAADPETRLEGFPILHLDLYRNDPAGISWPDWVAANGISRTAPERGMRFARAVPALDAVALAADTVALAWPTTTGRRCQHALTARYRADPAPHIRQFRAWLAREGASTEAWIAAEAGG